MAMLSRKIDLLCSFVSNNNKGIGPDFFKRHVHCPDNGSDSGKNEIIEYSINNNIVYSRIARFFGTIYQNGKNYTKLSQNRKMSIKYIEQP
jgi:hypothetical protein